MKFVPDSTRVLLRPFIPSVESRVKSIISRVMSLSNEEVEAHLREVTAEFAGRHTGTENLLEAHYRRVAKFQLTDREPERPRRLLIGSYFTSEYALECAALFNPSAVPHPDQGNLPPGALRFVMSLRATGEGHISSIEFREGVLAADNSIHIEATNRFVTAPELVSDPSYEKPLFERKLEEMGFHGGITSEIIDPLAGGVQPGGTQPFAHQLQTPAGLFAQDRVARGVARARQHPVAREEQLRGRVPRKRAAERAHYLPGIG